MRVFLGTGLKMNDKILVVIPSFLPNLWCFELLNWLQRSNVHHVALFDNSGSFPESKIQNLKKVELIRSGCNLNWLASNNLGAMMALEGNYDYVCFMNDDVLLSGDFFKGILRTFEVADNPGVVVPRYNGSFCKAASHKKATPKNWQPQDKDIEVNYTDGTCMTVPVEVIKKVGFFDPSFRFPNWGADVDYCYRARQKGYKCYVSCRSMLWHNHKRGGTSASVYYGNVIKWLKTGNDQARADLTDKYGKDFKSVLSLDDNAYNMK